MKADATKTLEVQALLVEIWFDIDHNWGKDVHTRFAQDAALTFDARTFHGRSEIQKVYRDRRDRGPRTSRHLVTNTRISWTDSDAASVHSMLCLFAADGASKPDTVVPASVADVHDEVRKVDGEWLVTSRRIVTQFIAQDTVLAVPTK